MIELMRTSGYTWTEIANALQTSRTTIWRRMKESGYQIIRYTDISDEECDSTLTAVQEENPNYRQQLIRGFLNSRGIHIQNVRVFWRLIL